MIRDYFNDYPKHRVDFETNLKHYVDHERLMEAQCIGKILSLSRKRYSHDFEMVIGDAEKESTSGLGLRVHVSKYALLNMYVGHYVLISSMYGYVHVHAIVPHLSEIPEARSVITRLFDIDEQKLFEEPLKTATYSPIINTAPIRHAIGYCGKTFASVWRKSMDKVTRKKPVHTHM